MEVFDKIGKGSYGTVYRCRSREFFGSSYVAIKIMPFEFHCKFFEENMVSILRELWASSSKNCGIKRLGVVLFASGTLHKYGLKTCDDNVCEENLLGIGIALPLGDFTLQALMSRAAQTRTLIPRRIVSAIVEQLAKKLSNLHTNLQCIHRDLKPANIVLSIKEGNLVLDIIDYGMLTFRTKSRDPGVTTAPFRAPEIFLRSSYDNKADVWSFGTIVFELLCGEHFCDFGYIDEDEGNDTLVLQNIWDRVGRPSCGEIDAFDTLEGIRALGNMSVPPKTPLSNVFMSAHRRLLLEHQCNEGCESPCSFLNSSIQLDDLDHLALSCLQLDPDRRPLMKDIVPLKFDTFNTAFHKIQSMDYLVKISALLSPPPSPPPSSSCAPPPPPPPPTSTPTPTPTSSSLHTPSLPLKKAHKLVSLSDIRLYSLPSFTIPGPTNYSLDSSVVKFDFIRGDISMYYASLRDEKNAKIAIVEGILKLKSIHNFPDSFVWNCLMVSDAHLCRILLSYATQHVAFTQMEADVFSCAVSFICAAPFEERPFVLEQDFLRAFLRSSSTCSTCSSLPFPSTHFHIQDAHVSKITMPSELAVMSAIVDLLKRCDFTLMTFAEYRGRPSHEVNSYPYEKCKALIDRFCDTSGENAWINSFGLTV